MCLFCHSFVTIVFFFIFIETVCLFLDYVPFSLSVRLSVCLLVYMCSVCISRGFGVFSCLLQSHFTSWAQKYTVCRGRDEYARALAKITIIKIKEENYTKRLDNRANEHASCCVFSFICPCNLYFFYIETFYVLLHLHNIPKSIYSTAILNRRSFCPQKINNKTKKLYTHRHTRPKWNGRNRDKKKSTREAHRI